MVNVDFTVDSTVVETPPVVPKEMISVGVDETTGKTLVRINSSSLGVIQECLRKAQYSLLEGWRAGTESPATLFGRAIHKALEVFYSGHPEERVLPKYEHLEMMSYGHKPPPTNNDLIYRSVAAFLEIAQPLAALPEGDKRSAQNGVWILFEYFKKFIDDPYVCLFTEKQFTHRFHEDPTLIVDIFGTIDAAFKHMSSGETLIVDHKTTSSLGWGDSSYYDRDKPNHQYTAYMLGANRELGIKTESFMVNVLQVKPKPKTVRGSIPDFPRQITKRTEEDFEELRQPIMKAVHDYLQAKATGVWPMGPIGACNAYGACQFKKVCAAPKSMRETILKNTFTKEGTV